MDGWLTGANLGPGSQTERSAEMEMESNGFEERDGRIADGLG